MTKAEPLHYELGEWFYKQSLDKVISHKEIAERIKELRAEYEIKKAPVYNSDVTKYISLVREYLET